ncbi:MAG: c-type cytochrome [Novosphingobium sp.]
MAYSPQSRLVCHSDDRDRRLALRCAFASPEEWKRPAFHGSTEAPRSISRGRGGTAALVAWDPVRQRQVWRRPVPTNVSGGVMATAGNLVFQGSIDNSFNAFDARTGKVLWSFDTKAPTIAPPISYSAKGRQYVTVLTGSGGSLVLKGDVFGKYAIGYREQARRVLTFVLYGKQTLPDASPYRFEPVPDPGYLARPEAEARGLGIYAQTCIMCHGRDGDGSGGNAPDLRASPMILDSQAFATVVREGVLRRQGMPRFDDLTETMVEDIRAYLRMLAHKAASESRER